MNCLCVFSYVYILILCFVCLKPHSFRTFTDSDIKMYRQKAVKMFHHAYDHYLKSAFPYDELQPISCQGMDTWGSFSLTLIDALDTLAVMKNFTEFRRVVDILLAKADFNVNINVSVFETNIRVVGGLLSAHLLSKKAGLDIDPGWPCSGPLLNLAEKVARRLLPAFETKTGMPFGTVNLRYGVPEGETPITCTAGVATFLIEFGTLSHLTGDPVFEKVAVNALDALWKYRSPLGLVGNHINIQDGKWTVLDSGIGGGVDSYFEYLVKGAILFQEPKYLRMFKEYEKVISKYMKKDDWYFWVSMNSGQVTMPTFQSLEAFWPGLLTLVGNLEQAVKTLYNYHTIWKQYGFIPEIYDVSHSHAKRENYPLRPEFAESIMYLYSATKDQHLLEIGVDILESIERSARTECGYATIKNVLDHKIEDRMESFFLAETTKYLYLLFDPDNFIHDNGSCGELIQMSSGNCIIGAGGYIFNTEAHPIDIGAVYCCSARHQDHQLHLNDFQRNMDLHSLLEINDNTEFFKAFKSKQSFRGKYDKMKLKQILSQSEGSNVSNYSSSLDDVNSTEVPTHFLNVNYTSPEILITNIEQPTEGDVNSTVVPTHFLNINDTSPEILITNIEQPTDDLFLDQNAINNNSIIMSLNLSLQSSVPNLENSNSSFIYTEAELKSNVSIGQLIVNSSSQMTRQVLHNDIINITSEGQLKSEILENIIKSSSSYEIDLASNSNEISLNFSGIAIEVDDAEILPSSLNNEEFNKYELLMCPAQPFTARLNIMGEMFNV